MWKCRENGPKGGGWGLGEASWLMLCGWGKMGRDNQRPIGRPHLISRRDPDEQEWGVSRIARRTGGWRCWDQRDWRPIGPKPACGVSSRLYTRHILPRLLFSPTQSVGGAVNNVATGKINCEQAAGLGGAFWAQASLKRSPGLWSFKRARKWGKQGCSFGLEEHGGRSNREGSQLPC